MGSGTGGGVGEQLTQNTLGAQSGQIVGVGVGTDGVGVGEQLTQNKLGTGTFGDGTTGGGGLL